jgi:hypothetical protein
MQDLGIGATGEGRDGGVTGSAAGSTPSFKQDVVRARAGVSRFGCSCHAQTMYGSNASSSATAIARMMLLVKCALREAAMPKNARACHLAYFSTHCCAAASSKMAHQEDMELDNMLAEGHDDFDDNHCMQDEDDDAELQSAPRYACLS